MIIELFLLLTIAVPIFYLLLRNKRGKVILLIKTCLLLLPLFYFISYFPYEMGDKITLLFLFLIVISLFLLNEKKKILKSDISSSSDSSANSRKELKFYDVISIILLIMFYLICFFWSPI